jgi:hypothetical protein
MKMQSRDETITFPPFDFPYSTVTEGFKRDFHYG